MFSWSYILIPFLVVLCLIGTVCSKNMQKRLGQEKWILLMILGFSYHANFSRGLVRHSLAEGLGACVIWSRYLFLALFISCYKNNQRLLLPVFMAFMLCSTLLSQGSNFAAIPIADSAVSTPSATIESWRIGRFNREEYEELKFAQDRMLARGEVIDEDDRVDERLMTYWQKLKDEQKVVERVLLGQDLKNKVGAYGLVLNNLLGKDETFVDFINKTLIYSLLGKENPVYVSQSPLQLSGEFTQRQFIEEIRDVPLVLMPLDSDNDRASNSLDGLANAYRNYKVAEYIYQNYVPLCRYDSMYVVWCLRDRAQEYRARAEGLVTGTDYLKQIEDYGGLLFDNCELTENTDSTYTLVTANGAAAVCELQNLMDLETFEGMNILVRIGYTADASGVMTMFYTTEKGENFTDEKSVSVEMNGIAEFSIPITKYTRLRWSIPGSHTIRLSSFVIKPYCDFIDYGYDGPIENVDANGTVTYSYISALHHYDIGHIARIWAESDTKNAADNQVLAKLAYQDGFYMFDTSGITVGENGNYLKISATYDGSDTRGQYRTEDETISATIAAGWYENGQFSEKCSFSMTLTEGMHDYLIRVSADYYWYQKEINAVRIQADETLHDVSVQVLEGD